MKTKLFLTVALFLALTAVSAAQQQGTGKEKQNVTSTGTAWVDSNNDGVCDNFAERSATRPAGNGNGCLRTGGQGQGNGMRNGKRGAGQGRNAGKNYVDANNNGVCDLRESQPEK